jgi:integrase
MAAPERPPKRWRRRLNNSKQVRPKTGRSTAVADQPATTVQAPAAEQSLADYIRTENARDQEDLEAIDLHFHDLRREAGSRWLEGGVPLHTVRDWLGHTSIAQTSTYLASTMATAHDAMARFDACRGLQALGKPQGGRVDSGPSATAATVN